MSAMRPSSDSAAGANSQPPVCLGKPGDVEAGRAVVGVQQPEAGAGEDLVAPALAGSTLAIVEADRNW